MTQFLNIVLDPSANRREVMDGSQPVEPHWNVWAAGFGGSQITGGNTMLGATTSSVSGTVVGADYALSKQTNAGFALAGGGTAFSSNLGAGRSDLFQAGAFIRQTVKDAYVAAALAYGWQDVTVLTGLDQLQAEANANAYSGRIETGYRFAMLWLAIAPYAAGQYTAIDLPPPAAQAYPGPLPAVAGTTSATGTRSELGFRTDRSLSSQDAALTLRGRLAWAHDFDPDRTTATLLQTRSGALTGIAQAPDSALAIASVELKWLNSLLASVSFQGEFSTATQSYTGRAFVRYVW
jgi:outer membrane autotransporter protein